MRHLYILTLFLTLACFSSCKNSDSESDNNSSNNPDNNSCDVLGLNNKIVGGTSCANPELSAVVRIVLTTNDDQIANCTGTMITSNKLITAAHCFEDVASATVEIGDQPLTIRSINAKVVYIHPDFNDPNNTTNRNDIAILELVSNAGLPVMPILLGRDLDVGEIVSVFGYGQEDSGDVSSTLRSGEMKISDVNNDFVKALYEGTGSNVCFGDSGGPLFASHNGRVAIFGTTSFGTRTDCQSGDNTSFVKLQSADALEFINRNAAGALFQ